jgi:hypothetical protein
MVQRKTPAAATRAKLSLALTKHLVSDFDEHGAEVIAKMRKEKPVDYVKLVTAILQKEDAGEAALEPTYNVVERRIIRPGDPHS